MPRYVALLRGINVGGNKKVPMAELRGMATGLGLTDVRTLLQSGNLIFSSRSTAPATLERTLEAATAKTIGVECSYLIREAKDWRAIIEANPFRAMAKSDPSHLVVQFCRETPDPSALQALRAEARGDEDFSAVGREIFMAFPQGQGESKLALAMTRKRLGTICSGRNWNTVLKIAELL